MVQASRRKFHYIYKITRVDTQKYYIGMHSTDNLEDGYFGSGKLITASVKKHGKEKHIKEILEHCDSRESLKIREKELVNQDLLEDKMCMNIRLGGEGGWGHVNDGSAAHTERASKAASKRNRELVGSQLAKDIALKAVETKRLRGSFPSWSRNATEAGAKAAQTPEAKAKRAATRKANRFQQGEKNSQFGSRYIYNDELKECKRIGKDELIPEGWSKGRKIKFNH